MLDKNQITAITQAVKGFNNSPWIDLGEKLDIKIELERAVVYGAEVILNEINREDIRLFHYEEARCGCI